ncbi:hypothetical protein [Mycolicibacterium helvum]|uniref:PE-PGRS family protein n=1 Tax=Mycolicibacterium helvum TaxID=1534349 RepID=A0A7I7T1I4_9MYCO|nr:hypothetical protein [Mycolicibacterium helvum]BBY63134.1 hypothetical protein MHEL_13770 [Mycolicibacterium helvum]
MQIAVRSYLVAGVAAVGATALVAAPIQPTLPSVQVPASQIAALSVELSAAVNPLVPWVDLVANTFNSVAHIGSELVSDPLPALRQVINNQIGYAESAGQSVEGFVKGMIDWATGDGYGALLPSLKLIADDLAAGQVADAMTNLNTTLIMMFLGGPAQLMGMLQIPVNISKNVTAVLEAVNTQVMFVGLGALQTAFGVNLAFGYSADEVLGAIKAGDLGTAISTLISMPAVIADAALNGYYVNEWTTFPGLFTDIPDQIPGLIPSLLLHLPRAIAAAIAPQQSQARLVALNQPAAATDGTVGEATGEGTPAVGEEGPGNSSPAAGASSTPSTEANTGDTEASAAPTPGTTVRAGVKARTGTAGLNSGNTESGSTKVDSAQNGPDASGPKTRGGHKSGFGKSGKPTKSGSDGAGSTAGAGGGSE